MQPDLTDLLDHASDGAFNIPCYKADGGIDLHAKSNIGDTLLHVAVCLKDTDAIRYLVKAGLDINAQGDYHETPLFFAASQSDVVCAKLLLELGADATISDHRGSLPPLNKIAEQDAAPNC